MEKTGSMASQILQGTPSRRGSWPPLARWA